MDLSSAPVVLNGPMGLGGDVFYFGIDPTAQRVIYNADQDTGDVEELYTVPIDGSAAAVKLSETLPLGYAALLFPRKASFSPRREEVGR